MSTALQALHRRWQAVLAADPQAACLMIGERRLDRAALEAEVLAQAAWLHEAGLQPGEVLAWLGVNSVEMLAMLLACARHDMVFLPLNWRLADDELLAVCAHAGVRRLVATPDHAEAAQRLLSRGAEQPVQDTGTRPGDLLLVYTSGTTGRPKGALHTQAQLVANADAAIAVQGLHATTRTLTALPMFHVGGLCIQTLPTLLAGGVVRLQPRFEPGAWLADVAAWRPTTAVLVPATLRAVIEHPAWRETDLSSLRVVYTGSSVVPPTLIEAFHARGVPVAQVYGSTETGPFSIAQRPTEALARVGQTGTPAPGVRVRLVDEAGQDVAVGAVGELWIAGDNVMRGYHREPAHPGFVGGWFRSGDLARRDADGHHEVVGRSKDMIISGGENIYPAEIENLVAGWPDVAECAVVGLPDARWGEVPVLAVVPRPGVALDSAALPARFEGHLARYKQPRRIVVLDALPRTALGKVQAALLRQRLAEA